MAVMHEKFVQSVMNQVPFIVYNVFSVMGGITNVALLQLKGLASSKPTFMLTEGNPTPQGSGSSTRAKSTRVETTSLRHLFGLPNPNKASSLSPPNPEVVSEHVAMDMDDIA